MVIHKFYYDDGYGFFYMKDTDGHIWNYVPYGRPHWVRCEMSLSNMKRIKAKYLIAALENVREYVC